MPIDNLYFYSTLFWSAKESVYKKLNIPNIFLKSNIKIENIDFENNIINAELIYKDIIVKINVFWSIYDSMVVTYTDWEIGDWETGRLNDEEKWRREDWMTRRQCDRESGWNIKKYEIVKIYEIYFL